MTISITPQTSNTINFSTKKQNLKNNYVSSNLKQDSFSKSNINFTGMSYKEFERFCRTLEPGTLKKAFGKSSMTEFYEKFNDLETNNYGKFTAWFGAKSLKELLQKDNIETLLEKRHFSPKVISYVRSFTKEFNYEVLQLLSRDKCCHSNTMRRAACFTTEDNAEMAYRAALYKDYDYIDRLSEYTRNPHKIILDMRDIHTKEYHPQWTNLERWSYEEREIKRDYIENILKNRGSDPRKIDYVKSFVDEETFKIIEMLSCDKDCPIDMIQWASGYANIENEELMRYAASKKDYDAIFQIGSGKIREKSEIDARQARKSSSSSYSEQTSSSEHTQSTKTQKPKGWTKEQFVEHIQKVLPSRSFKTYLLKDTEVRNLAKLLGTTPEQIRNMDKKEYRRLSLKFHPDRAKDGEQEYFSFINTLYNGSK